MLPGASCSKNHTRCCCSDSGIGWSRGPGPTGSLAGTVGARYTSARLSVTASCAVTSAASRPTSSELPPSAKKSSAAPTCTPPSKPATIPASARSVDVRGGAGIASARPASARPGAGNAVRSTLPLGVFGSAGSTTIAAGTM